MLIVALLRRAGKVNCGFTCANFHGNLEKRRIQLFRSDHYINSKVYQIPRRLYIVKPRYYEKSTSSQV